MFSDSSVDHFSIYRQDNDSASARAPEQSLRDMVRRDIEQNEIADRRRAREPTGFLPRRKTKFRHKTRHISRAQLDSVKRRLFPAESFENVKSRLFPAESAENVKRRLFPAESSENATSTPMDEEAHNFEFKQIKHSHYYNREKEKYICSYLLPENQHCSERSRLQNEQRITNSRVRKTHSRKFTYEELPDLDSLNKGITNSRVRKTHSRKFTFEELPDIDSSNKEFTFEELPDIDSSNKEFTFGKLPDLDSSPNKNFILQKFFESDASLNEMFQGKLNIMETENDLPITLETDPKMNRKERKKLDTA